MQSNHLEKSKITQLHTAGWDVSKLPVISKGSGDARNIEQLWFAHEDSCWAAGRRIQCAVWKRDLGLRFVAQVLRRRGICQAPASVTYLTLSKAPRNKLSQSSVFECYLVTAQYSRRTSLQVDRNYENLLRRITRVWKCTWLSQLIFSGDATNSLGQYRRPRPEGKLCGEKKNHCGSNNNNIF
jgi:hypothetical protein